MYICLDWTANIEPPVSVMFMDFTGLLFLYLPAASSLGGLISTQPLSVQQGLFFGGAGGGESVEGELQVDMTKSPRQHRTAVCAAHLRKGMKGLRDQSET